MVSAVSGRDFLSILDDCRTSGNLVLCWLEQPRFLSVIDGSEAQVVSRSIAGKVGSMVEFGNQM